MTSRINVTIHEAAGATYTVALPDINDLTHTDYLTFNASSGQFDVVGTHGAYFGVARQVQWAGGFAEGDFIWADRLYVEAPNGTRLVSIDAGDTPILLDLALDGEDGFSDVIDILGVNAAGNGYANYMTGGRQADFVRGMGGEDLLYGNGGSDTLDGGRGNDHVVGGSGNDRVVGGSGNDRVVGGTGNDLIIGGTGRDDLYGQSGADRFDFNTCETGDVIRDFDRLDYIDLSSIDANTRARGNQAFSFIGDHAFTGRAGQLSYDDESGMLRMDVNGDRVADGSIRIANEYNLASFDFIL